MGIVDWYANKGISLEDPDWYKAWEKCREEGARYGGFAGLDAGERMFRMDMLVCYLAWKNSQEDTADDGEGYSVTDEENGERWR
jgi:hypothetical protein